MSLEAALAKTNELLEAQNGLLAKLLASAGTVTNNTTAAAAAEDGEKTAEPKKRGPKPKDKTEDAGSAASAAADYAITFADLKKKFAAWLGEYAKAEDKDAPEGAHPEVAARKAALKETLGKIDAKQLPDIENDAKKLTAVNKWFETKAKVVDHVGAGAGRYAADPAADEDGDAGEEDGDLDL